MSENCKSHPFNASRLRISVARTPTAWERDLAMMARSIDIHFTPLVYVMVERLKVFQSGRVVGVKLMVRSAHEAA